MTGPVELYVPRSVEDHGTWSLGGLTMKIYGLRAPGTTITEQIETAARSILRDAVPDRVAAMGGSNGAGFVILHPGALGLSISTNWWAQGSVLCQHFHREVYGQAAPCDPEDRSGIGCVWELAIIHAETLSWKTHMMGAAPDLGAYLAARVPFDTV